jgi:hypothetical protein
MSLKDYIEAPKSGTVTVTEIGTSLADLAGLTETKTNGVVLLQVGSSEADDVEAYAVDFTTGVLIPNDTSLNPMYVDDLDKLILKRVGSANISLRFFAF